MGARGFEPRTSSLSGMRSKPTELCARKWGGRTCRPVRWVILPSQWSLSNGGDEFFSVFIQVEGLLSLEAAFSSDRPRYRLVGPVNSILLEDRLITEKIDTNGQFPTMKSPKNEMSPSPAAKGAVRGDENYINNLYRGGVSC